MMISDYLLIGKENAQTAAQLAEMLELPNVRTVSKMVERERRLGIPICASNDPAKPGYYLTDRADVWARYVKSLSGREHEVARTLNACVDTLDKLTGQERVEGW